MEKHYKIYSFYIDERFLSKKTIEYSAKIKVEYENKILDFLYGFNDYVSSFGNRCDFDIRYTTIDKDDILKLIEFTAKKNNIDDYLIENL